MIALVVVAVLLLVSIFYLVTRRERYTPPPVPPHRLMPTSEVHVDPETGSRQRVWVDPVSGTRSFVDENVPPGTPGYHQPPTIPVPHATRIGSPAPEPAEVIDTRAAEAPPVSPPG